MAHLEKLRRFTDKPIMESPTHRRKKVLSFASKPAMALTQSLTTFVEGIHFDLLHATPREVAYKAGIAALSDLAAQGAVPHHLYVQCALRQDINEHLILEWEGGIQELARLFKIEVDFVLGTLSPTANLIEVLASGNAPKKRKLNSPKANDFIVVTGGLGGAAAAMTCLRQLGRPALTNFDSLTRAYLKPSARVKEAQALYEKNLATAITDLQDGLASELNRVISAYDLGALVDESLLPLSPHAVRGAELMGMSADRWTLYGAEDFELMFCVSQKKWGAVERNLKRFNCQPVVIGQLKPKIFGIKIQDKTGTLTALPPRLWHPLVRRRRA